MDTVVCALALLLALEGSVSAPVTLTLLVIVPTLCGTTAIWTGREPEFAIAFPRLHVTVPLASTGSFLGGSRPIDR